MSEKILKALMQLFAIIAHPESNEGDRRTIVESFLMRQLNKELTQEYLEDFDSYYKTHQEKHRAKNKERAVLSASSVKVLKIGTEINEELTQNQKIIVLFQLLEFSSSEAGTITEQELEFIKTLSETFNINPTEFAELRDFVLNQPNQIPISPSILVIDHRKKAPAKLVKHVYSPGFGSQIWILQISSAGMYLLKYSGEQELYLNSQLLQKEKVYVFNTGASIRDRKTKPIYYSDIVGQFRADRIEEKINFQAINLDYKFKGGKFGIRDISFEEESGRLVGIMGASGSGKSTLLNVLNGSHTPSKGEVLINGIDIHKDKEKAEGIIGFVSQDDLLMEELSVYQNLYYNAKLCFDNYTEEEIVNTVNQVLNNLGLFEIKDIQVGSPLNKKISGGQRKRLNIALELLREPAVLFLDEPTSGLSSRDSENIMDLLKELVLKGKLVFVVIHQPSSDIFKMFDSLLILDTGGFSIYYGDPIDSIIYFKSKVHQANFNESECRTCGNVNPEQIFNIIESQVLDEYGKTAGTRKISPAEWNAYYSEYSGKKVRAKKEEKHLPEINFKIPSLYRQWKIFVKRDVLSKLSNTQYLVINFLEAPLLAFFLASLIKYYDVSATNQYGYTLFENVNLPVYIFMAVIVAIFIGLTVSAEEIIKDRKILKREAFLNLSWNSYLLSKVTVQLSISALQAFAFVMVGNAIMEIKGMYWQYWLVLFSSWSMANLIGLLISDSFKTVVTIYILIPFLVIPQIILSGIIVKYEKLNPLVSTPNSIPWYGEVITARWAYEALMVYQYKENKYESQFYSYDKMKSIATFRKDYWYNNLKNKVLSLSRNFDNPDKKDINAYNLEVLRNEITKQMITNSQIPFENIDMLYPELCTFEVIAEVTKYLERTKAYYIKVYNSEDSKRDKLIRELEKEDKKAYQNSYRTYQNEQLTKFVRNDSEKGKAIIEYEGRLIQKIDPIFLDPEFRFVKAHFYAPRKMIFGKFKSTFWVNIVVLWIMTILLYFALSFRLLKRLLDAAGGLGDKIAHKPSQLAY
ncbi:MAG: ATP-binding cassette domain-containing protein [Bacteroidales bacterium]|nr:ATP-binding cassette domain-containing protein [Bacteroidales bacterium]